MHGAAAAGVSALLERRDKPGETEMLIVALFLNACALCFVVGAVCSMLHGRTTRATKKGGELAVSSMAGLTLGAMFLGLKAIVQPEARHAIVEIVEEKSLEDGSGGEPPGGRVFHEELRRIRCGEAVEGVTVRVDPPAHSDETGRAAPQEETRSS
ncbi:MAG TPA: hypothetical protein VHU89_14775 [Acidobacteriaceae bacterium]|jgi:hypothetical protein|nr:hypothetical protein [Acidobacteriaceae bacterium]